MPEVPIPSERALREGQRFTVVDGGRGNNAAAEAMLRGSRSRAEYDPDVFYGAAFNNHDHTEKIRLNVHPDVVRAMSRCVNTGQLNAVGIDSMNKFFRACMVDGLHKVARLTGSPEMQVLAESQHALARLDEIQESIVRFNASIERFETAAGTALNERDWQHFAETIEQGESIHAGMPEPYAARLRDRIDFYAARLPH